MGKIQTDSIAQLTVIDCFKMMLNSTSNCHLLSCSIAVLTSRIVLVADIVASGAKIYSVKGDKKNCLIKAGRYQTDLAPGIPRCEHADPYLRPTSPHLDLTSHLPALTTAPSHTSCQTDFSHYTHLNANQPANLQYLTNFYAERATKHSHISYLFRNTGISIKILIHEKIPVPESKRLLWTWMRNKQLDRLSSDGGEVEILVVKRCAMVDRSADSEYQEVEMSVEGSEEAR